MLFRFGTHWPHCGQTSDQFRSDVVHLRFKVGSSLDQMFFRCGSIWVQIKPNVLKSLGQCWFRFHAQLVHGWFDGCSNLPDVWFGAGSSVVQLWLRFGSGLVQSWVHTLHVCGSDAVLGSLLVHVVELCGFPFESDMVHFGFVLVLVQLKFSVRSSLASFGFRLGPRLVHMCSRHGSDVAQSEPHLNRQWFFVGPNLVQIELYVGYSLRFSVRPNLWRSLK